MRATIANADQARVERDALSSQGFGGLKIAMTEHRAPVVSASWVPLTISPSLAFLLFN
jgi:hypothetical protein